MDIDISPPESPSSSPEAGAGPLCCAPLRHEALSKQDARSAAEVFKALADPHRIQIVNLLANSKQPVCVCDITADLGVAQPTASFHLKKLWSVGLLDRKKVGTWAFYSLNDQALKALAKVIGTKGSRT